MAAGNKASAGERSIKPDTGRRGIVSERRPAGQEGHWGIPRGGVSVCVCLYVCVSISLSLCMYVCANEG